MRSSVPPDDTKADARPTLLAALARGEEREAAAMGDGSMTYAELRAAVAAAAAQLPAGERVALWAAPSLATVVGLLGGLAAGAPLVPLNPKAGAAELTHHLDDARPGAVIAPPRDRAAAGARRAATDRRARRGGRRAGRPAARRAAG
jgi:acyl-CoA synthetase (AMP-forming)/AMP-acid ligase II